jgi:hypothetical protein
MCVESVSDKGTSQPRQKPWSDQWGIGSGLDKEREPIERGCVTAWPGGEKDMQ